jgi:hypothetical protein
VWACEWLVVWGRGRGHDREVDRGEMILQRVFDIFDKDGDGCVDHAELMAGLSVLCGGSTESKVRTAFQLFDTNGDGYIDMEEMATYLTSVFKVRVIPLPVWCSVVGVAGVSRSRRPPWARSSFTCSVDLHPSSTAHPRSHTSTSPCVRQHLGPAVVSARRAALVSGCPSLSTSIPTHPTPPTHLPSSGHLRDLPRHSGERGRDPRGDGGGHDHPKLRGRRCQRRRPPVHRGVRAVVPGGWTVRRRW